MIKYICRLTRKVWRLYSGFRSSWWILRSNIQASLNGGVLIFDKMLRLYCPVRCDGQGRVLIEEKVSLGYGKAPRYGSGEILIQARKKSARIEIGSGTAMSNNVVLIANESIKIGKQCLIGDLVSIFDSDFHAIHVHDRKISCGDVAPVCIGDNVWLGARVMVMKGVSIGDNSVISAGSIVTKSIPPDVIAGGVPANVIRSTSAH